MTGHNGGGGEAILYTIHYTDTSNLHYTSTSNIHSQLPNNGILKNNFSNTFTPDQVYFLVLESSAGQYGPPQEAPIRVTVNIPLFGN